MPRFEKTRIHWVAAALFLIGLYAVAGLLYAWSAHSADSVTIWAIVAIVAFLSAVVSQRIVVARRARP